MGDAATGDEADDTAASSSSSSGSATVAASDDDDDDDDDEAWTTGTRMAFSAGDGSCWAIERRHSLSETGA